MLDPKIRQKRDHDDGPSERDVFQWGSSSENLIGVARRLWDQNRTFCHQMRSASLVPQARALRYRSRTRAWLCRLGQAASSHLSIANGGGFSSVRDIAKSLETDMVSMTVCYRFGDFHASILEIACLLGLNRSIDGSWLIGGRKSLGYS